MASRPWIEIILEAPSIPEAWTAIFEKLLEQALASVSPVELHSQTVAPDRLLAESAWELWTAYQEEAPKTSEALRRWCSEPSSQGRAVLVLDALSLRELPALLVGADARSVTPTSVQVMGSEVPSDTICVNLTRWERGRPARKERPRWPRSRA